MQYTQLDFAPYSPKRPTLEAQAEFLLREIVAGKAHEFPCECGACVYWAYRQRKKAEGRSFSARTFFVYFLRASLFVETFRAGMVGRSRKVTFFRTGEEPDRGLVERLAHDGLELMPDAMDIKFELKLRQLDYDKLRRRGLEFNKCHPRRRPKHSMEVHYDRIRKITRQRTLSMTKKLEKRHQAPAVTVFLRGILNKKSFYTYYKRAGDEELALTVRTMRQKLASERCRLFVD